MYMCQTRVNYVTCVLWFTMGVSALLVQSALWEEIFILVICAFGNRHRKWFQWNQLNVNHLYCMYTCTCIYSYMQTVHNQFLPVRLYTFTQVLLSGTYLTTSHYNTFTCSLCDWQSPLPPQMWCWLPSIMKVGATSPVPSTGTGTAWTWDRRETWLGTWQPVCVQQVFTWDSTTASENGTTHCTSRWDCMKNIKVVVASICLFTCFLVVFKHTCMITSIMGFFLSRSILCWLLLMVLKISVFCVP